MCIRGLKLTACVDGAAVECSLDGAGGILRRPVALGRLVQQDELLSGGALHQHTVVRVVVVHVAVHVLAARGVHTVGGICRTDGRPVSQLGSGGSLCHCAVCAPRSLRQTGSVGTWLLSKLQVGIGT